MSMPSRNFTIDNVSPLIRYDPKEKWKPGSTKEDPQADRYYRSTFTTTVLADATATFQFNGTNIYVYGAKRFNHRLYTVDLDGAAKTYDGHPRSGVDEFQAVLYSANDLDPETPHTIIVSCEQNSYLDIDYITWTNSIGNETTIQDSDDAFAYSGEWLHGEDTANSMLYGNGVGHQTQDEDGYVNLTFAGSAISLYGVVGDGLGVYSVQLDESDIEFFNATNWGDTQGQAMLYHASSLDDGQHSLVVSNAPDHLSFDNLTIDYAIVYAKGREGGSRSLSKGAIAGVVVACVCILLAAGVATLLGLRWRRRTSQHGGGMDDSTMSTWRSHVDPFNMHRRTEERSKASVGPVEDHGVPPATLQRPHLGKRSARETGQAAIVQSTAVQRKGLLGNHAVGSTPPTPPLPQISPFASDSLNRTSEPVPVQVASETIWGGRVSIDGRADDLDPPPAPPNYEQAMQTMPRQ